VDFTTSDGECGAGPLRLQPANAKATAGAATYPAEAGEETGVAGGVKEFLEHEAHEGHEVLLFDLKVRDLRVSIKLRRLHPRPSRFLY
jgi:hypothetical protein